jgi:hypothetical protein
VNRATNLIAIFPIFFSAGKKAATILRAFARELVEQNYKGSYESVRDNLVRLLPTGRKNLANSSSKAPVLPTSRQAAFLFLHRSEELRVEEQETLVKLRQINPEVDLAYDLVQQFAQMLRTRTGDLLDAWLAKGWNKATFPNSSPLLLALRKTKTR